MSRGFNPNDYDTVDSRIGKFWADYASGRILTELVFRDDRQYIVRAEVFTDRDDDRPVASGYAEEVIGSSPVNKTSALENCETSAIGRALANLNYATKARPSQTEMGKAERVAERDEPPATVEAARSLLGMSCRQNRWDIGVVAARYAEQHDGQDIRDATDPAVVEAFRRSLFEVSDAELRGETASVNGARS